ncbi:hypothetical protein BGW42_003375 [Actinomortierella wolfii]|nr:hypothetical protein BGW42_003375 [Actinomortierella wolfii]
MDVMHDAECNNNANAMWSLAKMFGRDGNMGVIVEDPSFALHWYLKAAHLGHVEAQYCAAQMYYHGDGTCESMVDAHAWYLEAALQQHAEAQYCLGEMYESGQGSLEQNDKEAVNWYIKAAQQNCLKAQYRLGVMYENGEGGLTQNDQEAVYWYQQVANQSDPYGAYRLGFMCEHGRGVSVDGYKAKQCYRLAAAGGVVYAMTRLGCLHLKGVRGIQQDDALALFWFHQAALHEDNSALCYLGWMYTLGRGVDAPDDRKAFEYYSIGADNGSALAQFSLGVMYELGIGVDANDHEAKFWLEKAATQDISEAAFHLSLIEEKQECKAQTTAVGQLWDHIEWYKRAAEQGMAAASFNLGLIYEKGQGVPKDNLQALVWLDKAHQQGHEIVND